MAEHDINWPKKFVPSQVSFLTGKDNNFIGKKVYLPLYVIFYCPEKVNVDVFFKQKDKVCDSQVRICLSLLLLQMRIRLFFSRESACVTVKMTMQ